MGGFSSAYNSTAATVHNIWPKKPKLADGLIAFGAVAALALDVAAEKYASRPLPRTGQTNASWSITTHSWPRIHPWPAPLLPPPST